MELDPAGYTILDASGERAWFGWPDLPEIESDIRDWYDALDEPAQKRAVEAINRASIDYVTYVPTGFFLGNTAWRAGVGGIQKAPFPLFWGVTMG